MAAQLVEPMKRLGVPPVRLAIVGVFGAGAVAVALLVASVPLAAASHTRTLADVPVGVACLAVGVLLATQRPDNAMGWCLLGAALFLALNDVAGSYSVLDYHMHRGALPLGWVAVLLQPSWAPGIVLLGLSFMLFPDGHFSSRVTKRVTGLLLAVGSVWLAGAFGMVMQAVLGHAVHVDRTGNLLLIDHPHGAWAWWSFAQGAFFVTLGASWLIWLVQQVPRYRRATDERRHQMKWLLSGAVVTIASGALILVGGANAMSWLVTVGLTGLAVLPVSIAIGVMKFRLYDIDRIVSRTLSYAILTGTVVGVYIGIVTLTTRAIGFSSSVGVAASTLVAAALFNPLRRRLQRVVDRRFNRARYDAERTTSEFAARLRDAVDPGTVRADLIDVVHSAFEPSGASVWIRPPRSTG